ncbi:MAG: uroporphyrinogen-III C-methyltransferase [Flavobacteriaceae bacterium]
MKLVKKHIETGTSPGRIKSAKRGKLSVVGAGPGDPELITLKAVKALQSADTVLYDALVDTELLKYAAGAELVFVGKRKGCYAFHQQQINELIVQRALEGKYVVRLKGGDPFVFGRGAEEIEYAAVYGVTSDVIQGISSAVAVPAGLNIPVTKRGVSESFWVITGTTRDHQLSSDIHLAAKSSATIVILMGMSKLTAIVNCFKNEGRGKVPVAVIQNGTTAHENFGIGTIDSIENEVKKRQLSNPAIIVIGEVVNHRIQLLRTREQFKMQMIH